MSSLSKFLLAITTLFIVGMAIEDPDATNRPVQLREASLGYAVLEQSDE